MNFVACILFVLFGLVNDTCAQEFIWKDCGRYSMVTFKKLVIEPLPLMITRSSAHYLSSNIIINRNIPLDAELSLVVNKTINFGGMKFPYTVPCSNGFGSCRYSFCDIFQQKRSRSLVCPLFSKYKQTCSCPIKKGNYSVRRVKVKLPLENYGALARNAAAINGHYSARVMIQNKANTKSFACIDLKFHIRLRLN